MCFSPWLSLPRVGEGRFRTIATLPDTRNFRGLATRRACGYAQGMKSDNNSSSAAPAGRSFRLVCPACRIPQVEELLRAQGYEFEPEPFSPWCRRLLAEPRPLGASLAAFFGYIYIQDRSSMLPPLALAPAEGAAVLDMCASPGSKTGFLAQLVGPGGFVLGNEPSRARLATLRANLHACNWPHAATCSYEGQTLPLTPESWDWILLDPPCSGWGTVEKNPQVLTLWQGDKVKTLVGLQQMLLAHAARLLRPGGRLVYSTCTTNDEENEAQVRYAEEELGLRRLPLTPFDGFVWENRPGGEGTLRVDGEKSGAQGFYVALFTRDTATSCEDVRDEAAEDVREWVCYHLGLGFSHVALYDNGSREPLREVLAPLVARGVVSVTDFTLREAPQLSAYFHALRLWRGRVFWLAFLDIDEFLVPLTSPGQGDAFPPLSRLLRPYERFGGVWTLSATNALTEATITQDIRFTCAEPGGYGYERTISATTTNLLGYNETLKWNFQYSYNEDTHEGTLSFVAGTRIGTISISGTDQEVMWANYVPVTAESGYVTMDPIVGTWNTSDDEKTISPVSFGDSQLVATFDDGSGYYSFVGMFSNITLTRKQ